MSETKCLTCTERHKQKTCTDPYHNHKVVKQLELLTDYDKMLFVEEGKRGGLSGVMGTRHVIANNKYLSNYDKNKESIFLAYFDATNLYGISMNQFLPYAGFAWWSEQSINYYNSNLEEATR